MEFRGNNPQFESIYYLGKPKEDFSSADLGRFGVVGSYLEYNENNHITKIYLTDFKVTYTDTDDFTIAVQTQFDRGYKIWQQQQAVKQLEQRKNAFLIHAQEQQEVIFNDSKAKLKSARDRGLYKNQDWAEAELPAYLHADFIDATITDESSLLSMANIKYVLNQQDLVDVILGNRKQRDIVTIFESIVDIEQDKAIQELHTRINGMEQRELDFCTAINNNTPLIQSASAWGLSIVIDMAKPIAPFIQALIKRIESTGGLQIIHDIPYLHDFTIDMATAEKELQLNPTLLNKFIFNMFEQEVFDILAGANEEKLEAILTDIAGDQLSHQQILNLIQGIKNKNAEVQASRKRK